MIYLNLETSVLDSEERAHRKMTYAEKLKDPRWQKKRLAIFSRDGWQCRDCHAREIELQVHHCFYEKGDPWDTDDRYLITLCSNCHPLRQDLENDAKRALALILVSTTTAGEPPAALRAFVTNLVRMASDAKKVENDA